MADEILGGALSDRQTMSEAVARPESERSDLLELPDAVRDQLIEGSAPVNESLKGFVKGVKKALTPKTREEKNQELRDAGVVPRDDTAEGGRFYRMGKKPKHKQKNLPGMEGVKTEAKKLTVPGDVNVMPHVMKPKHYKPKMHGIHKLSVPSEQNANVDKVSKAGPGNNTISHHAVGDAAGNGVSKAASVKLTSNQLMKLKEAHDIMRTAGLLEGKSWNDFGGAEAAYKVVTPGDKEITAGIKKASKMQTLKPSLADTRKTPYSEDDETQGRIHNDMDRMHNMGKGGRDESPIGQQGPKSNIVTFKDHKERQSFDEFVDMVTEKNYSWMPRGKMGKARTDRNKNAATLKLIRKKGYRSAEENPNQMVQGIQQARSKPSETVSGVAAAKSHKRAEKAGVKL
jgi:hypothetical protein